MNIIIPIGGKCERFQTKYINPKPLINIFEKHMIEYVLDNLNCTKEDYIFIIYNSKLDLFDFSNIINKKYPFIKLIKIEYDTKGAVETLKLGIDFIINNYNYYKKTLIQDCDTFYTEDIRNIFHYSKDNLVFYTKNYEVNAIYSYIELNDKTEIINIQEKKKISDNVNTGAYAFTDINILYDFCKYILDNNITFNNESRMSCVITEMVKNIHKFNGYELNKNFVFSLGTPEMVDKYINDTHAFLFDLDGTLVLTDDIYFNVWHDILIKYNISLTLEIFKSYIQGNNDMYVSKTLLKNIKISLNELSKQKDELFIKNIDKIKIIEGSKEIIECVKKRGFKICIVTNCNKNVAQKIIEYIDIYRNIDFIISSEDCINGKPHPEPYMKAIKKYDIDKNKCIIFEDSKSGISSGKSTNPKLLIGIETIYDKDVLIKNHGCDVSISNYVDLNIDALINYDFYDKLKYLNGLIKSNSIIDNIEEIIIDDLKLKGGFIADVISFKIITKEKKYSQILKYENKDVNNLSLIAKQLNLYEREYYFYTNISKYININFPKFINIVVNENYKNIGIVLENLFDKTYKINLNLNLESIDTTLKIIDNMAKMHSKFWNKNLKNIFPELNNSMDCIFYPFFTNFINERYGLFKEKWFKNLNEYQIEKCEEIYNNFENIQKRFALGNNLTFIHGDIKSPNIFYDTKNNNEPYFIDWQHCAIGKGVQDMIFFVIESFDIADIKIKFELIKNYYYIKIKEYGIINYSIEEYEKDIYDAICYVPFFTSIWFGTTPQDELIDKNFPYFFISKLFYLIEISPYRQIGAADGTHN